MCDQATEIYNLALSYKIIQFNKVETLVALA